MGVVFQVKRTAGQNTVDHLDRIRDHNVKHNLAYATLAEQRANSERPTTHQTGATCNEVYRLRGEKWTTMSILPGGYQVSNMGRWRTAQNSDVSFTPKPAKSGYASREGNGKSYLIHRLVAFAFCAKPRGWSWKNSRKWVVHHIDGDTTNNKARNLRWVTSAVNTQLANELATRRKDSKAKESTKQCKPVLAKKEGIGHKWVPFKSASDASRELDINSGDISKCLTRKKLSRSAGGYQFKYAPNPNQKLLPGEEFRRITPEILRKTRMITSGEWDKEVAKKLKAKRRREKAAAAKQKKRRKR